jgi:hypothetical protein
MSTPPHDSASAEGVNIGAQAPTDDPALGATEAESLTTGVERVPAGALGLTYLSDDFDAPDPFVEALWAGD